MRYAVRAVVAMAAAGVLSGSMTAAAAADDTAPADSPRTRVSRVPKQQTMHPSAPPTAGSGDEAGFGHEAHDGLSDDTTSPHASTTSPHTAGYGREPHDGIADNVSGDSPADQIARLTIKAQEHADELDRQAVLYEERQRRAWAATAQALMNDASKLNEAAHDEFLAAVAVGQFELASGALQLAGGGPMPGPKPYSGNAMSPPPGKQPAELGPGHTPGPKSG